MLTSHPHTLPSPSPQTIGYDTCSDAERCAAITRAIKTGQAASTAILALFAEQTLNITRAGTIIYLPVYDTVDASQITYSASGDRVPDGLVFMPFRWQAVLENVLPPLTTGVMLTVSTPNVTGGPTSGTFIVSGDSVEEVDPSIANAPLFQQKYRIKSESECGSVCAC